MVATILVLVVVAVLLIAAVGFLAARKRRTTALRGRFGPEYDRVLREVGDRGRAERLLGGRAQRVEHLPLRPLSAVDAARFGAAWTRVQERFVDDPEGAVDEGHALVGEAMAARGYPVGDFEQRAADLSVDHPRVVESYRAALAVFERKRRGEASTEELRGALVHYRALFQELLERAGGTRKAAA